MSHNMQPENVFIKNDDYYFSLFNVPRNQSLSQATQATNFSFL